MRAVIGRRWAHNRVLTGLLPLCAFIFPMLTSVGSASAACANNALRSGPSAALPDCRAYELVSPALSNGRLLRDPVTATPFNMFPTELMSIGGETAVFATNAGPLAEPGGGSGNVDVYQAVRTAAGWQTVRRITPSGEQATFPGIGGLSADHAYGFVTVEHEGSLARSVTANYLSKPDGSFQLIGIGSLGEEPAAQGRFITASGSHIIYSTGASSVQSDWCLHTGGCPTAQLEPEAPPIGTPTVYDRSVGGTTHVVSLLPGDVTPGAGQGSEFEGVSKNGSVVVFVFVPTQARYARINNSETIEVGSGSALTAGATLTCTTTTTGTANSFQWLRNGVPIGGATNSAYTTGAADAGKVIQCRVTATNAETSSRKVGAAIGVAPAPTTPSPSPGSPTVTGTANVGQTLTCNTGTWAGSPTFTFQWLRNGSPIPLASASTYLLEAIDKGAAVQCEVTGTNAGGTAVADSTGTLVNGLPPTASVNPSISGIVSSGETLSCNPGTWTNSPAFSYEWLRNGTAIGGATAQTYVVVAEDEGGTLQCRVTATNSDAVAQAVAARVVVPPPPSTTPPLLTTAGTVTGTPSVGNALTCNTGSWAGAPTFIRQWLRNGVPIGGATGTTYTLVEADIETSIQCMVTATNAGGTAAAINASATNGSRYVVHRLRPATVSLNSTKFEFAGVSADGTYVFYVEGGNVFSFDTGSGATDIITASGNAELVNISENGSHVYFLSTSLLDGSKGTAGDPNLYVWDRATNAITFIATVSPSDLGSVPGLNKWTSWAVTPNKSAGQGPGGDSSRTTPDGNVLLFESHAQLTHYDNGGHTEIYRYDAASRTLLCVSCNPSGEPVIADARLEAPTSSGLSFGVGGSTYAIHNLSADGSRAFFETAEALQPADLDGVNDIYEWNVEEDGVASEPHLISSGQSIYYTNPDFALEEISEPNILLGINPSGRDVMFLALEALTPEAGEGGVLGIYDAREGGGFPAATLGCDGLSSCNSAAGGQPSFPAPSSDSLTGARNVNRQRHRCRSIARAKHRRRHRPCGGKHRHTHHKHASQGGR